MRRKFTTFDITSEKNQKEVDAPLAKKFKETPKEDTDNTNSDWIENELNYCRKLALEDMNQSTIQLNHTFSLILEKQNEYDLQFEVPTLVVVGMQSSTKSTLIQSFIGYDFNFVDSSMGTRCPIIFQLVNDSTCEEPVVHLTDQVYAHEEKYVHDEVMIDNSLERNYDVNKAYDFKELKFILEKITKAIEVHMGGVCETPFFIKLRYKHCWNLTLMDTPGLRLQKDAVSKKIKKLVVKLCQQEQHHILCCDSADEEWRNSNIMNIFKEEDIDQNFQRTIFVKTKFDNRCRTFQKEEEAKTYFTTDGMFNDHMKERLFYVALPYGSTYNNYSQKNVSYSKIMKLFYVDNLKIIDKCKLSEPFRNQMLEKIGIYRLKAFVQKYMHDIYCSYLKELMFKMDDKSDMIVQRRSVINSKIKKLKDDDVVENYLKPCHEKIEFLVKKSIWKFEHFENWNTNFLIISNLFTNKIKEKYSKNIKEDIEMMIQNDETLFDSMGIEDYHKETQLSKINQKEKLFGFHQIKRLNVLFRLHFSELLDLTYENYMEMKNKMNVGFYVHNQEDSMNADDSTAWITQFKNCITEKDLSVLNELCNECYAHWIREKLLMWMNWVASGTTVTVDYIMHCISLFIIDHFNMGGDDVFMQIVTIISERWSTWFHQKILHFKEETLNKLYKTGIENPFLNAMITTTHSDIDKMLTEDFLTVCKDSNIDVNNKEQCLERLCYEILKNNINYDKEIILANILTSFHKYFDTVMFHDWIAKKNQEIDELTTNKDDLFNKNMKKTIEKYEKELQKNDDLLLILEEEKKNLQQNIV